MYALNGTFSPDFNITRECQKDRLRDALQHVIGPPTGGHAIIGRNRNASFSAITKYLATSLCPTRRAVSETQTDQRAAELHRSYKFPSAINQQIQWEMHRRGLRRNLS